MANSNWNERWSIAKERFNAAQMAVDDAFKQDAPYEEVMALIAYKANEWGNYRGILDELLER